MTGLPSTSQLAKILPAMNATGQTRCHTNPSVTVPKRAENDGNKRSQHGHHFCM